MSICPDRADYVSDFPSRWLASGWHYPERFRVCFQQVDYVFRFRSLSRRLNRIHLLLLVRELQLAADRAERVPPEDRHYLVRRETYRPLASMGVSSASRSAAFVCRACAEGGG